MNHVAKCSVLGVWANVFTIDTFMATMRQAINSHTRCIIGNHNLHSIYLHHHDAQMHAFFEVVDYAYIDGMPFVLWGKLMGFPLERVHRLTCVDWVPQLIERCAAEHWRVFYLGAKPGVAARGAEQFRTQLPGLNIATAHGYFDLDSADNARIVAQINAFDPDILLVGMGMPRQEDWIYQNYTQLSARCIITVGAVIDYLTGEIPTPPRWTGQMGLEWLARLIAEPRRLGKRYLVEPWFLLPYMAQDVTARLRGRHGREEA